ncbi:MAG: hypothetical protein GY832_23605 [Chloroflexi bacterium]|nr:hypothetical protein [Chloroflexota bacterium]
MTNKKLILTASPDPVDPKPGVYRGVPWGEYASWDCFSKSMVGAALKSGAHLDHYIHRPRTSGAMALGSLVDCLVLEPELYDERYIIQPDTYTSTKTTGRSPNKVTTEVEKPWNLNSKVCRALAEEIAATGKAIVTNADLEKATAIRTALMNNAEAALAITDSEKQVSFVWVDEKTGIKCKGRADLVNSDTIDDLKTARDASPEDFCRAIGKFLYHVQAAAYTEAWGQLTGEDKAFRFIVAETGDIPAVALYELDSVSIIAGGLMFRRALVNVARWLDRGVEGYSPWFEPIEAPRWMVDREINMSDEEVEL